MEIKDHFYDEKKKNIRRKIVPGNSKSLWSAVKVSMDVGAGTLPKCMTLGGVGIDVHKRSDSFAQFFDTKIKAIINDVEINPSVYNGIKKLIATNYMFMSSNEIKKCINGIKIKNCEGYDRIPQRIFVDGVDCLLEPLSL